MDIILLFIGVCVIGVWIVGFFMSNDLKVPSGTIHSKNTLVIYPHPDDETLASGGLISRLCKEHSSVTLIVLTKGERGNDDAHEDQSLKITREKELARATAHLGISKVILEDFGDGQLTKKQKILSSYIKKAIQTYSPDTIVTYDLAGLYGHDDHIVTSEIITSFVKKQFPHIRLIYASLPDKVIRLIKLPEHMANNPQYAKRRVSPHMKIWIGISIFSRIKALYSHESQLYSFRKSFPVTWIPLWFYYSMQLFEYYHVAHEEQ